jgi:RNA polymerase sigma-70 factor (ECF subfamily)
MKSTINLTDQEAVQLFMSGNAQGIEILVNRHKDRIFTCISLLVKDNYLAEDLFQDVFIKIIENLKAGKYNEENKFLHWAMRIAHNHCMDHFRKQKSKMVIKTSEDKDIFDVIPFEDADPEQKIIKQQTEKQVREMISELPKEQQDVVILRHYADLKFKEIAEILKCSVNTALGRMHYALVNIRKLIEEKQLALQ